MHLDDTDVHELHRHLANIHLALGVVRFHPALTAPESGVLDVAYRSTLALLDLFADRSEAERAESLDDASPVTRHPNDQPTATSPTPPPTPAAEPRSTVASRPTG